MQLTWIICGGSQCISSDHTQLPNIVATINSTQVSIQIVPHQPFKLRIQIFTSCINIKIFLRQSSVIDDHYTLIEQSVDTLTSFLQNKFIN